jgi:hypothetical protein
LASKSKIPPQLGGALLQIREQVGEGVDAFGFHARIPLASSLYSAQSAVAAREKYEF